MDFIQAEPSGTTVAILRVCASAAENRQALSSTANMNDLIIATIPEG
jgi:hypothetical protein